MEATASSRYHHHGTRRATAPSATLERLLPLLPEIGITRVANITGLDWIGVPVVTAVRPGSRSLVVSQGKGLTLTDAKVSALMESIEMFHAERPDIPLRLASVRDLARERQPLLDLGRMPRLHDARIDDDEVLLWTPGEDLASHGKAWVPYACVAIDDTLRGVAGPRAIASNSNGLASGNTRAEAVTHALCEVIERDASTLWHLGPDSGRDGTAVDLASVDDPNCLALLQRFERAEIDVFAFETTSDIGVPAYEVLIREKGADETREPFSAVGSGSHLWRGIALSRALTEAAQCRLTHIAGAREDLAQSDYDATDQKRAQVQRYLAVAAGDRRPYRPAGGADRRPEQSFDQSVDELVGALARVGLDQAIMIDLTAARFGIPVVKVLVPGLEGVAYEHGYAPNARVLAAQGARP